MAIGYLFLVVTAVVHLSDKGVRYRAGELRLVSPEMGALQVVLLGLLLAGGITMLASNFGKWWGWVGTLLLFGLWAMFTAMVGKPVTAVIAVGCLIYFLSRP